MVVFITCAAVAAVVLGLVAAVELRERSLARVKVASKSKRHPK